MSANKRSETKIPEDENVDSGCVSESYELYSGEVIEPPESEAPKKVSHDISDQKTEGDSGVVDLSDYLSVVQISETSVARPDLPPIVIFFQPDDDGDTQLHIASVHGCEKSVGTLINVCPNKALLDLANEDGHTPLHLAVMSGNAIVTRMLVRAGLSLGVRDRTGETPLHKATASGYVECLKALLAPVPEHPPRKLSSVLNQKNYNGQACVHLAATAGHLEALQTLLFFGADVDLTENLAGWTALHIAARRGDVRLAMYLRERADVHARDYADRTPRRLARHTPAARAFARMPDDSDSDEDEDDDMYDSDSERESLFERLRENLNPINVA